MGLERLQISWGKLHKMDVPRGRGGVDISSGIAEEATVPNNTEVQTANSAKSTLTLLVEGFTIRRCLLRFFKKVSALLELSMVAPSLLVAQSPD